MNVNLTSPAYPCTPIQDQYNRLVVPNAGINKLEYFALEIYKSFLIKNDITVNPMKKSIENAIIFIELIEQKTKTSENEKTSKLVSL